VVSRCGLQCPQGCDLLGRPGRGLADASEHVEDPLLPRCVTGDREEEAVVVGGLAAELAVGTEVGLE
jgi:hypothetical protein